MFRLVIRSASSSSREASFWKTIPGRADHPRQVAGLLAVQGVRDDRGVAPGRTAVAERVVERLGRRLALDDRILGRGPPRAVGS